MMRRFLVVDDEIHVLHALQRTIRQHVAEKDIHVETFTESDKALERCGEVDFDLVISDYRMPGINGIDFLRTVKAIQPDAVRMMLSASSEFDTIVHAVNEAEVFRYIAKPWQAEEIADAILRGLERRDKLIDDRRLADEIRAQRDKSAAQQREARRLEELEPGITKVNWGPDGSVRLDE
ncbi:MAG TPA: response regulator [Paucimonas sp.]|nr:response regulator [Paucimonas sp.]